MDFSCHWDLWAKLKLFLMRIVFYWKIHFKKYQHPSPISIEPGLQEWKGEKLRDVIGIWLQQQSCNHSAAELGAEGVAVAGWTRSRQQPGGNSWGNNGMVWLLCLKEHGFWQRNLLKFLFSFWEWGTEKKTQLAESEREGKEPSVWSNTGGRRRFQLHGWGSVCYKGGW